MSSEGGEGDERVVKRSVDSDNAPTDTTKSANRKKTKVDAPAAADPEAKTTQDDDEEEVEVAFDSLIRTENESVRRRQQPGVDLFAVPDYQGTPITEVNIDQLDDKPWTKPGADISDWFNYGFNEDTWRSYLERHRVLRRNYPSGQPDMGGAPPPFPGQQRQLSALSSGDASSSAMNFPPGGPGMRAGIRSADPHGQARQQQQASGGGRFHPSFPTNMMPPPGMMPRVPPMVTPASMNLGRSSNFGSTAPSSGLQVSQTTPPTANIRPEMRAAPPPGSAGDQPKRQLTSLTGDQ